MTGPLRRDGGAGRRFEQTEAGAEALASFCPGWYTGGTKRKDDGYETLAQRTAGRPDPACPGLLRRGPGDPAGGERHGLHASGRFVPGGRRLYPCGPGEEDPADKSGPEGQTLPPDSGNASEDNSGSGEAIPENGSYTAKEDVALYIHTYGCLPDNFITKKEAQDLGWSGGSLEPWAPGMCIGGNRFGNYEGLLPEAEGRSYTECDIDTLGAGSRGAKRIVFSNDGLIYYTEDHYASFELLYGEE